MALGLLFKDYNQRIPNLLFLLFCKIVTVQIVIVYTYLGWILLQVAVLALAITDCRSSIKAAMGLLLHHGIRNEGNSDLW